MTKKVWVAPKLDELAVEKTLGGPLNFQKEQLIYNPDENTFEPFRGPES